MSRDRRLPLVDPEAVGRPPVFRHIAILGLEGPGLTLARACRRAWPAALVIGVDHGEALEQAIRLQAIDLGASDLSIVAGADLVVLAGRPETRLEQLRQVSTCLEHEAVVTDLGGPKAGLLDVARHLPRVLFVGGHLAPIPADETGGRATGQSAVRRWWLMPDPGEAGGEVVRRLGAFAAALGFTPEILDSPEYDRRLREDGLTDTGPPA